MRDRSLSGHSRRVAEVARKIADALGADRSMTQDLVYAALLQDIGKIGWRDQLLHTPEELIAGTDLAEIRAHPIKGEAAMMGLAGLRGAATMVRSHRERFDGSGYPDALAGDEIPLGARILAVAKDFDAVQVGTLIDQRLSPGEALRFIEDGEGSRYDPKVAAVLRVSLAISPDQGDEQVECAPLESELAPHELRPGMTLSRDLVSPEGFLLLAAEEQLSARHIEHLVAYAGVEGQPVRVWVHPEH
jgi:HD-GYP domain-containing protein (c-di-GMP phosphodiesterase class II)